LPAPVLACSRFIDRSRSPPRSIPLTINPELIKNLDFIQILGLNRLKMWEFVSKFAERGGERALHNTFSSWFHPPRPLKATHLKTLGVKYD
jgi:hypothetical protein